MWSKIRFNEEFWKFLRTKERPKQALCRRGAELWRHMAMHGSAAHQSGGWGIQFISGPAGTINATDWRARFVHQCRRGERRRHRCSVRWPSRRRRCSIYMLLPPLELVKICVRTRTQSHERHEWKVQCTCAREHDHSTDVARESGQIQGVTYIMSRTLHMNGADQ